MYVRALSDERFSITLLTTFRRIYNVVYKYAPSLFASTTMLLGREFWSNVWLDRNFSRYAFPGAPLSVLRARIPYICTHLWLRQIFDSEAFSGHVTEGGLLPVSSRAILFDAKIARWRLYSSGKENVNLCTHARASIKTRDRTLRARRSDDDSRPIIKRLPNFVVNFVTFA